MIRLEGLSKYYPTRYGPHYVFRDINLRIPDDRDVAILGVNGAGKSTLMRIIGGIDQPSSGRVVSDRFISWPLGLTSGLNNQMTGRENTRFVCRIHGIRHTRAVERFVQDFAEIGDNYDLPIKGYSSGMRSKFNFALSMGFDFDTYLIDEVMAVGDQSFQRKCDDVLTEKRKSANVILISHQKGKVRNHCNAALLLAYGKAEFYESVEQAILRYDWL